MEDFRGKRQKIQEKTRAFAGAAFGTPRHHSEPLERDRNWREIRHLQAARKNRRGTASDADVAFFHGRKRASR